MSYVPINAEHVVSDEEWFTIGDLIELANNHPEKKFKFIGTEYAPIELISWRGSYDLPAILASVETVTGKELSKSLIRGLEETHYGYKGGEYEYHSNDEFYISICHSDYNCHSVDGYHIEGDTVLLNTNINEY